MSDHAQEHTQEEICVKIPLVFEELNVFCLWLTKSYALWGTRLFQLCDMEPHWDPCYAG